MVVDRPPLALVPGLMTTHEAFAHTIEALQGVCEVRCIDTRPASSITEMARLVVESMPGRFAVCGFSMGGFAALETAILAPDRVTHCIVTAAGARADDEARKQGRLDLIAKAKAAGSFFDDVWAPVLRNILLPDSYNNPAIMDLSRKMAADLGLETFVRHVRALRDRRDLRPDLGKIRCPTLVMASPNDPLRGPETQHEMVDGISDAQLVWIREAAHGIPIEAPAAFTHHVKRFLIQATAKARAATQTGAPPMPVVATTPDPSPFQRFLARMLEHHLAAPDTGARFLRRFPALDLMRSLDSRPDLRARMAEIATGLRREIGLKKSAAALGEDIQFALEQGLCEPHELLAALPADDCVLLLDNSALWNFAVDCTSWVGDPEHAESARAVDTVELVLKLALEHELITSRDIVDAVGLDTLGRALPRELLTKMLSIALGLGREQKAFTDQALIEAATLRTLVTQLGHKIVWDRIVVDALSRAVSGTGTRSGTTQTSSGTARTGSAATSTDVVPPRPRPAAPNPGSATPRPRPAAPNPGSATPRPTTAQTGPGTAGTGTGSGTTRTRPEAGTTDPRAAVTAEMEVAIPDPEDIVEISEMTEDFDDLFDDQTEVPVESRTPVAKG